MLKPILRNKAAIAFIVAVLMLVPWWIVNYTQNADQNSIYLYGLVYSWIALAGGINGLLIARKWGGLKSLVGKAITFFSLGLLGEWLGQTVWSYYNLVAKVEVPFPSLADFGYFSIIPFYGLAMICLAKAAGTKYNIHKNINKFLVIALPLGMLAFAYALFLRNVELDIGHPVEAFLTFGTPLGEAVVFSLALITFQLSRGLLGGVMQKRILLIIGILMFRYVTGVTFLYRYNQGIYYNGDIVDLLFTIYFALMAIGLNSFSMKSDSSLVAKPETQNEGTQVQNLPQEAMISPPESVINSADNRTNAPTVNVSDASRPQPALNDLISNQTSASSLTMPNPAPIVPAAAPEVRSAPMLNITANQPDSVASQTNLSPLQTQIPAPQANSDLENPDESR